MKRLFALLLVLSFLLAGCSSGSTSREHVLQSNSASKVSQEKMNKEQLDAMTQQAEYAMLAAFLQLQEIREGVIYADPAYVGDVDQDGTLEMVYSYDALTFDLSDGYYANICYDEYGHLFQTAKNGEMYLLGSIGDFEPELYESYSSIYKKWNGSVWEKAAVCYTEKSYSGSTANVEKFEAEINGEEVSEADWDAYMGKLSLTAVETSINDVSSFRLEKQFRNAVEQELYSYLEQHHDCGSKVVFDADEDGQKETFIAVRNPMRVWMESLESQGGYQIQEDWLELDVYSDYTVILVSDPGKDDVTISTYCISGQTNFYEECIEYANGSLTVDGTILSPPQGLSAIRDLDETQKDQVHGYVCSLLESMGCEPYCFRWTDLSDTGNQELLCLCKENGEWCVKVFTVQDGRIVPIWQQEMSDGACYLVDWNGSEHLLCYNQWVSTEYHDFYTSYEYSLFRFDENYYYDEVDYQSISYTNNDQDATYIASFFSKFHRFFDSAVVVADTYGVSGQSWMDQENADYGTVPTSYEEGRLGYVQIEDASSFLNLREGPGTQYDVVLLDPYNKDSFVKQALGSPVTILEEVRTGDAENPVWVKIRIQYGGREVIGYSSKRFIREAN